MKVLICVRKLSVGGAEMLECRLAAALNSEGVTTDLLSQYNPGFLDSREDVKKWKSAGIPDIFWLNANSSFGILLAVYRLIVIIQSRQYDYVITTNTGLDTIAAIARFFIKFKHIVALHDYPHPSVTKSIRFRVWKKLVSKSIFKAYSISDFVKNENLNYLKISPEKISIIHNSIDLNTFENKKEDNREIIKKIKEVSGIKLVFIGRLVKRKGIDILLNLLSQLPENVSLIIAGDSFENALEEGAVNYHKEISSIIKRLKLERRVILLGQCKGIYEIMQCCDLMVHLPRHEGFGLVLLEAFAAGLPVVASNVGGIPEVIQFTSYKTFDLDKPEDILMEINRIISMDKNEKNVLIEKAKDILIYFSDQRRSKDIIEKILT